MRWRGVVGALVQGTVEKKELTFFGSRGETNSGEKGVDEIQATLQGILHATWRARQTPECDAASTKDVMKIGNFS